MTSATDTPRKSCLGCILLVLTFLWVSTVTMFVQYAAWGGILFGLEDLSALFTLGQVAAVGLPLLLLVWLWRPARERAIYRLWLLAATYVLLLLPSRLLDPAYSQYVLLSQLVISLLWLALIRRFLKPAAGKVSGQSWSPWLALAAAVLVGGPWLARGSLGSIMDSLLALALGLAVGLILGRMVASTWLLALTTDSRGRGWDIVTGGLVIATALLLVGSGLSFNGLQLPLMASLAGLGWVGMAVSYRTPPGGKDQYDWRPLALLIGLVAALVLALADTDPMAILVLDPGLLLAFKLALFSKLLGLALGVVAWLTRNRWGRRVNPGLAAAAACCLWATGILVYLVLGQPGFHGDRLFVILKEQADISAAAGIEDYDERRQFVYDNLVQTADQSQAALRSVLDRLGVDYQPYYLVNAIEMDGGLLARLLLLTRPEVDRVIPSPVLRPLPQLLETDTGQDLAPAAPEWNLSNIGADRVWDEFGVRGEGIVIGQSDSGVQLDHPELHAGYRGRDSGHDYNWLDPWTSAASPQDYGGHGTHTLGSVLGRSVGVAPGAEWIACANLQRNLGNPALYLDCLQFMLAPYPQAGDPLRDGDPTRSAHVLNNSWGCPQSHEGCDPGSMLPAVRALRAAGIFVAVSAGNEGPECGTVRDPIAIYDEVFSVGAVDLNNDLADFSSAGPVTVDGSGRVKPDILAPGVDVLSAYPGSTYSKASGTSMAGPHLAGVVALMWSANPDLIGDIDRTEQILIETARPFSGTIAGNELSVLFADYAADEAVDPLPDSVGPETITQAMELGSCLGQSDLGSVPNNAAGYGVVDAYAAVKRSLED